MCESKEVFFFFFSVAFVVDAGSAALPADCVLSACAHVRGEEVGGSNWRGVVGC